MKTRLIIPIILILLILTTIAVGQGFREILSRKDTSTFVFNFKNTIPEAVPTFVDIDGDRDLDIFVGQENGLISFYENTGNELNPSYAVPVLNPFGIGDNFENSAPAFVDLDNDGDYDLFVGSKGQAFNAISFYYENTGTPAIPVFEKSDDLSPFGLMPEGAHFMMKPTFGDLDADGDQDVLMGAADGFWYQENTGTIDNPEFGNLQKTPFGLPTFSISVELSPRLVDFDSDGYLDVLTGNINGNIAVYFNIGDSETPLFSGSSPRLLLREYRGRTAPAIGDIDNDGDIDMMIAYPNGTHMEWYMGVAGQNHFFPDTLFSIIDAVDVGFSAAPEFVDMDYDGDLDIIIGSETGDLYYHLNIGTLQSPDYLIHTINPYGLLNMGNTSSPASVKFDSTGQQTLFIGVGSGDFWEFENTGGIYSPSYILRGLNTRGLADVGSFATPAFVSTDGSNDYDLISGESEGGFKHFINQGNTVMPQFMQSQDDTPFDLGDIGFLSSPTFIDVDGDLDMDMFSGDIGGNIHFFRNNNLFSPMYGFKQTNVFDLYDYALVSSPSAGDIDNDGDVDLIVGYTNGKSVLFENRPCKSSYLLNHIYQGQKLYQSEGTITTKSYIANVFDVTLLGTQGVEMILGFEVDLGAELTTEVGECINN